MLTILTVLLPMFVVIAIGYFMTSYGFFTRAHLTGFGRFVMSLALPALIFKVLASRSISDIFIAPYFFGYAAASIILFFLGILFAKLRRQKLSGAALDGIGGVYSNTAFVGYPLLLGVIHEQSEIYFALNTIFECLILIPLFLTIAEYAVAKESGKRVNLLPLLINMFKKPIIFSLLLGILFSVLQLRLPGPLAKVITMLSYGAAPLALLIIGGGLCGLKLKGSIPDIVQITIFKLVAMPVLCTLFIWLFGGTEEMIFAGAILSAIVTANTVSIFSQFYGYPYRGTAAMLLTTLLSVFTLSLIFFIESLLTA